MQRGNFMKTEAALHKSEKFIKTATYKTAALMLRARLATLIKIRH